MWVEFDIPDLKKNPNKTKQESQSPQTGVDWQGHCKSLSGTEFFQAA